MRIVDYETAEPPQADDLAKLSAPLNSTLTGELDGAQWYLGVATEEILLAALGLTIARTIGEGVVPVDVAGHSGSVPLRCTSAGFATATESLAAVHRTLAGRPEARRSSQRNRRPRSSSPTSARSPECATPSSFGRIARPTWCSWIGGMTPAASTGSTVEELAEQLPLALIELTSEAMPPVDAPIAVGH